VNCTRAYTPIPLCTPARASLLNGCWPTRHGCIANPESEGWQPPIAGLPLCPELLRDSGYQTAYIAKWHVDGKKDPTHYGFDRYHPDEDYARWRAAQGLPPTFLWKGFDLKALFGRTDEAVPPEQTRVAWGADRTLDVLRDCASDEARRPWFVRWDPTEPHLPNIVPEPYASRYNTEELSPWSSFPDPLIGKPYAQRQAIRNWGLEDWTWEQWRPVVARYLGEIALLDAQVGRLLDWLDASGLAENTLVIYTSDHGDLCGGHGMMDKHFVMYDDVVRIPLMMRWPAGGIAGGKTCAAPIIHALDLPAALLEVGGLPIPKTFQGRSLLPWVQGDEKSWRDSVFSMYHGNIFGMYSQRMVTDGKGKYVWNATDLDEFYDLEADPAERVNLAADPARAGDAQIYRNRLLKWMEEIEDPLLTPWNRRVLEQGLKAS
jgi:arylsulfatase A-like enzyme